MTLARWYAVSTLSRHEKVVSELLQSKSIETFLPLTTTPSQWKDRRVLIQRPIFPGYVFTHIELHDRKDIYGVPGVLRILSCNGKPSVIEDAEIEVVRLFLNHGTNPQSHPYLAIGQRVRVKSGLFMGIEGVVTRHKNQCRLVISIAMIRQAVAVEIDADLLESVDLIPDRQAALR
jgi:transcription antitermination factor NusG